MEVRQAVLLVGGKGTRLGDLTQDTPKPLLEVAPGVRFLDVLLYEVARHGFDDILLLAGHHGDQIELAYNNKRVLDSKIEVLREPQAMGTGGALRHASARLAPWFLMGNGDSLFEINLRALAQSPDDSFDARLALRMIDDPARFGAVSLEGEHVVSFHEKNESLKGPALVNGGLYLLNRDPILGQIQGPASIEQDVFPKIAKAGHLLGKTFDGYFLDMGLPETYAQARREIPARRIRPAAFLDRDGVLNHDEGYTHKPEDLKLMPGASKAVRMLNEAGYLVIVVSNQAGVGRGLYTLDDMHAFHRALSDELAGAGAHLDAIYTCPYHAEAELDEYRVDNHPDRKPNPGMIITAMQEWPIDRSRSFLVGDKPSDIEAAKNAGIPGHAYAGGDLSELVARITGSAVG